MAIIVILVILVIIVLVAGTVIIIITLGVSKFRGSHPLQGFGEGLSSLSGVLGQF